MNIKKHIPNSLTSLNLLCGTLSAVFCLYGLVQVSVLLIFAGALFDFSDGFAARALKAYSPMGKELDSLADLISFGFAPAVILHVLLKKILLGNFDANILDTNLAIQVKVLLPFLLPVFSGLRLAKFNVDTRQSESFIGLTTTATGLFLSSLGYVFYKETGWLYTLINNQWLLLCMIPVFCFLLVSEIPMFSLKFKNYKIADNTDKYVLLIASLFFIVWQGIGGIAITIVLYVIFSIAKLIFSSNKKV